jgi:hypothetical protein
MVGAEWPRDTLFEVSILSEMGFLVFYSSFVRFCPHYLPLRSGVLDLFC